MSALNVATFTLLSYSRHNLSLHPVKSLKEMPFLLKELTPPHNEIMITIPL